MNEAEPVILQTYLIFDVNVIFSSQLELNFEVKLSYV
jgi:hypothetical protein